MATVYEVFLQNWASRIQMETVWQTDVTIAPSSMAEERRGLVGKPYRVMTVTWQGMDQDESTRLLFTLLRMADQELRVPLYQDVVQTTAPSSGSLIVAPTSVYRFFDSPSTFKVLIFELDSDNKPTNVHFDTITSTAGGITILGTLPVTYPTGSFVVPVLEVEVLLEASMDLLTDRLGSVSISFIEKNITSLVAANDYALYNTLFSPQVQTHTNGEDYYVLKIPETQWADTVKVTSNRPGDRSVLGRDSVISKQGFALLSFEFSLFFATHAEFWAKYSFFDAHQGRLIPFWLMNPLTMWDATAITTTTLDVGLHGDLNELTDNLTFVAIELNDGTVYIREFSGVSEPVAGTLRFTWTDPIPATTLSDVARVSSAVLCRFSSDSLRESWATDGVATMSFMVTEVFNEASLGTT